MTNNVSPPTVIKMNFDPEVAKELDTDCAIILENIKYWIAFNISNGKEKDHLHDGRWWTYNTGKGFQVLFWYLSEDAIQRRLLRLKESKYLITGNYNKVGYDRTIWYALGEKYEYTLKSLPQFCGMESAVLRNGIRSFAEPIPNDKPNNKPINENFENWIESKRERKASKVNRRFGSFPTANKPPSYKFAPRVKSAAHGEHIV